MNKARINLTLTGEANAKLRTLATERMMGEFVSSLIMSHKSDEDVSDSIAADIDTLNEDVMSLQTHIMSIDDRLTTIERMIRIVTKLSK